MKNREVLELSNGLRGLRKELTGRIFTHAVALNMEMIAPYVKALNEAKKPSESMKEYEDKFEAIKKKHAEKDEKGNAVLLEGRDPMNGEKTFFYDIPGNDDPHSEFIKERDELYEEHKEAIDEFNAMLQEWAEVLLEEDSKFEVEKVKLADVPDEINADEMRNIMPMINGK